MKRSLLFAACLLISSTGYAAIGEVRAERNCNVTLTVNNEMKVEQAKLTDECIGELKDAIQDPNDHNFRIDGPKPEFEIILTLSGGAYYGEQDIMAATLFQDGERVTPKPRYPVDASRVSAGENCGNLKQLLSQLPACRLY